jgi:hypothetical protein
MAWYPIVGPIAGKPLECRLLDDPAELLFHWQDGNYVVCFGRDCGLCRGRGQRRAKGFAAAIRHEWTEQIVGQGPGMMRRTLKILPIVAEFTQAVVDQLDGRECRGLLIRLQRAGKVNNTPVHVTVLESPLTYELPPAFPVQPIVMKRYRMDYWPDYGPEDEQPQLLRFQQRKQA